MAFRNNFSKKTLIVIMIMISSTTISPSPDAQVVNPNCQAKCGNVSIPYPFGTGAADCFLGTDFEIICNTSFNPPKPFLGKGNVEVLNISPEGQLRVLLRVAYDCYTDANVRTVFRTSTRLRRFPFSYTRNKFVAIGCDTYAVINGKSDRNLTTGCLSVCNSEDSVSTDGSCSGIGCCQTSIPRGLLNYTVRLSSFNNHSGIFDFNPCSYAFLAEEESFKFSKSYLKSFNNTHFRAVLDWAVGSKTCKDAIEDNSSTYACKSSFSICNETDNGPGYRCSCSPGYQGNAYIPNGCQDIDECADAALNNCKNPYCINKEGGFMCQCPKGYLGNGTDVDPCVAASDESLVIELTAGIGGGLLVLFICSLLLYFALRKRRHLKLKEKFFKQNGGLMLQQELATREGYNDSAKIYTAEELEKATNKYDETRIIGRGGYGTVYKGILTPDNKEVAIKKSKLVDQSQIEQFINEVVVLSQINHRNVVKLLGCCLETEVPLLVYEFVSNGTLFEHICDEKTAPDMSWDTRLRIAAETAGVLSYLHSAASIPIIHRDVKSTNILLDENFVAKVSDFGASKLVPLDQNELSTMVQGTLGYLDPEYLQTSQLTEKSDVYSFGVVLVELLTGKKPLSFDKPEKEKNLANYFLASIKEDFLFQILEDVVLKQGNPEQLREVANLAKNCLKVRGDDRPTMKEVAMELESLKVMALGKHSWVKGDMISEESESLLGNVDFSDKFDFGQCGSSATTSTVYDSIKDHVVLTVGGGR